MRYRVAQILIVILIVASLVIPPPIAEACGPDFSPPVFTGYNSPDALLDAYFAGRLGLLQRGYSRAYFYVAYRTLVGKPLSKAEVMAISKDWGDGANENTQETSGETPTNWIDSWIAARKRILGNAADPDFGYSTDTGIVREVQMQSAYFEYYNCLQGAFQNAVRILDQRVDSFGATNPYVRDWLDAQDQVFENCRGGNSETQESVIPAKALQSDPEVIRKDRAYQIAAAHFYSGDYGDAQSEFAVIASDPASPYRKMAPYLVARALVREGTLAADVQTSQRSLMQAEEKLQAILGDPYQRDIHAAAQKLLGFVLARLYPERRVGELEALLLSGKPDPNFSQDLTDYLWLLDRSESSSSATTKQPAGEEMTDWILTFQRGGSDTFRYSIGRWQATKSLPWLLAAISQAHANDAVPDGLENAARQISPDSPAYLTTRFHLLRLFIEEGKVSEARLGLDALLSNKALGLPASARNEFLALRMKIAVDLNDWLRYAPRLAVDLGAYSNDHEDSPLFDSDASILLTEKFPLHLLADAARSQTLPVSLKKEIALAAWTRAILLDDEGVGRQMALVLALLAPELKVLLDQYRSAKSSADRCFAAIFLILHFPGIRPFVPAGMPRSSFEGHEKLTDIDSYRDNWWCSMAPPHHTFWSANFYEMYTKLSLPLREVYMDGGVPFPSFLSEAQRSAVIKQWADLQSFPAAPSWMAQQTLLWATSHPRDLRVPEALHLVVHATRYGCTDSASSGYSRQAFTLLHSRYPHSDWAKKTPYWF